MGRISNFSPYINGGKKVGPYNDFHSPNQAVDRYGLITRCWVWVGQWVTVKKLDVGMWRESFTMRYSIYSILHFKHYLLGGSNSYIFYFHPYLGKISNLTNIFQMGDSTTNQYWCRWNLSTGMVTVSDRFPNFKRRFRVESNEHFGKQIEDLRMRKGCEMVLICTSFLSNCQAWCNEGLGACICVHQIPRVMP